MKAIKAILSGKGLPRRGEEGFTLVELLIVLAILAVLAAVVIPNILGMFGRGAAQAYDTDEETLQTSVATFYFDVHKFDTTDGWNEAAGTDGHYYPNQLANVPLVHVDTTTPIYIKGNIVYEVQTTAGAHLDNNTDTGSFYTLATPIWVGLLALAPGDGDTADPEDPEGSTPVAGEKGPYLNEAPESCSHYDAANNPCGNGNPSDPGGTYTWIIDRNGKVWGCSFIVAYDDIDETTVHSTSHASNYGWYAGFNGSYP